MQSIAPILRRILTDSLEHNSGFSALPVHMNSVFAGARSTYEGTCRSISANRPKTAHGYLFGGLGKCRPANRKRRCYDLAHRRKEVKPPGAVEHIRVEAAKHKNHKLGTFAERYQCQRFMLGRALAQQRRILKGTLCLATRSRRIEEP